MKKTWWSFDHVSEILKTTDVKITAKLFCEVFLVVSIHEVINLLTWFKTKSFLVF